MDPGAEHAAATTIIRQAFMKISHVNPQFMLNEPNPPMTKASYKKASSLTGSTLLWLASDTKLE